jgi:hypothetical protein
VPLLGTILTTILRGMEEGPRNAVPIIENSPGSKSDLLGARDLAFETWDSHDAQHAKSISISRLIGTDRPACKIRGAV